ncbi:type II toxin-antitoxin system Phd/YefM family antitoxin [bacterium]|nr:type II toxin-antitoxin system Phd/YefM family antitoxin [bacterium]
MVKYTYSQARQNFATVLNKAQSEGEVLVQRKDGSSFVIKPYKLNKSPLDVQGVHVNLSSSEIVDIVQETRRK